MSDADIERLRAQIEELERRAGISEEVADACLGSLIPDMGATSEEYFDETEDYARRKVRKLYFDIVDVALRKQLIEKR